MRRTPKGASRKVMNCTNHQPSPVFSSDCQPLMPTHPAKARKLMRQGRAVPHRVKGLFGIRLLDRTPRTVSSIGRGPQHRPRFADHRHRVVADDEDRQRTGIAVVEIKHRAFTIKATLTKRSNFPTQPTRTAAVSQPRFDNRRRQQGTLPPSVDSLRVDTMRQLT